MKRLSWRIVIAALVCLLLAGCNLRLPGSADSGSSGDGQSQSAAAPTAEQQQNAPSEQPQNEPQNTPSPSEEPPKNATWVIDINDTQTYTDEMGIAWRYTLTFHASKPGGTDVTGQYNGDAHLEIEPDFASVQSAAASEGTALLSLVFNYYADCDSLSFVVEKTGEEAEDGPLAPLVTADFFAESGAVFNAVQEPVTATIQDDDGPRTGSGGGGGATVDVPFIIEITGASVSVKFANLPQPFETSFNGTITGDVLPG